MAVARVSLAATKTACCGAAKLTGSVPLSFDEQVCEWLEDPGCRWKEPVVKIDCSQESLQLTDVGGLGVSEHGLHVAAQGLHASGRHLVAQELDGGLENALLRVDYQSCITHSRENFSQMLQMLLLVLAGYDDVV